MSEPITEADQGKQVVAADGESIGTVMKVDAGVVHVNLDSDLSESVKRRFDWGDAEDYTLQETEVESVTDDEVVVRSEAGAK
ncbi:PRC-barrel domain containing protein [Halorussus gelatinilyticus]|uniref:PRC-barrel domain containing protein n=1 Tax=Halorussus gelatinilyticus TaxID=2937524 RepID=A0A8U0IIK8_9EURY|nr:PRC-barrel domain containing protein [Halorussus gelatinilyticus]UPW00114.1 PRC-barrel domain containing protein [Halorussus gelatinilyticus]